MARLTTERGREKATVTPHVGGTSGAERGEIAGGRIAGRGRARRATAADGADAHRRVNVNKTRCRSQYRVRKP
ncbi:hypothetical protein GCM10023148_06450 [Actinokineospora soli]